jgi:hypothetical protein
MEHGIIVENRARGEERCKVYLSLDTYCISQNCHTALFAAHRAPSKKRAHPDVALCTARCVCAVLDFLVACSCADVKIHA